jgi:anti-sigma regulatory factor (Ser/Thr protein kinase)/N-acetylglutamate synthase-like GNAT family acetyltransferase
VFGEAAALLLREDQLPVRDDVELALLPTLDGRVVSGVTVYLGRETRGPGVVTVSDGAEEDADVHGATVHRRPFLAARTVALPYAPYDSTRVPRVKVTVPSDTNASSLVLAVLPAFVEAAGVPADDAPRLEALVEGLLRFTLEHAYSDDDPGDLEVTLTAVDGAVDVSVHDWGLPLTSAGADLGPLPDALAALATDARNVRLLNLGADGKRLAAELPVELRATRPAALAELPPAKRARSDDEVQIRGAEPDDAEGIAQLLYESYHLSYVHPDFYRPRYLVEALRSGHLVSTVAQHAGRLIGHHALMPVAGIPSAETGAAVVHLAYRGLGVFGRLYEHTLDEARRRGLASIFGDAVTIHPYTQQAQGAHGFRETTLQLGMQLAGMTVRGFGEASSGRTATLRSYLCFGEHARQVNLPAEYRGLLDSVYANAELAPEGPSSAVPAAGPAVTVGADEARGVGFVRVARWDHAAQASLGRSVRQLLSRHVDVVYADLDLAAVDDVDAAAAELNEHGFFAAGLVLDGPEGHDHFRLQRLNSEAIELDRIVCHSPFAQTLRQHVLDDMARVV